MRIHTRPAFAITRKKKLSSRRIGAISPIPTKQGGKKGRRAGAGGYGRARETILSRRRNSYRFFGWRTGWRAISCQSACLGKGGPFIRNRLKAQINKPCRRRFILHITSRPRRETIPVCFQLLPSRNRVCFAVISHRKYGMLVRTYRHHYECEYRPYMQS